MGRHPKKKTDAEKLSTKEKLRAIRKEKKLKLKQKRARLIVKNLPFQATEDNVKEYFGKFGEIDEVTILKREDGKLVGCGFVQFKLVQKAAKARYHLNGKPFLGREISVDFALAKKVYESKNEKKCEPIEEVKIKEEPLDDDEVPNVEIKTEEDDEMNEIIPKSEEIEKIEDSDDDKKNGSEEGDSDEEENEDDEESEDDVEEEEVKEESLNTKPKFESNDVTEGKTIFVKNVPFSATNEDLKQCMRQFGPVYYALICVDKYTEHSKGTAFVKFVNKEDAEKALSAGTELTLLGNVLDCHQALGRKEVKEKTSSKNEVKKDSRNLYLVKEGVILAGSKAAEGVSAADMAKRLQLEQYKTQMLRNLNMFLSPVRLVVHNLPSSWDDKKFRALVQNNCPKNAVIKEARIMRDLKNVDASGVGKSKEFGFVSFARHEDALITLRNLNNNPNIFSATRRPIVTFSIENKAMIKAKEKRLEKSRLKNPKCKQFDLNVVKADEEKKKKKIEIEEKKEEEKKFAGVQAKPGTVQKMRSKFKLKTQAKLHFENLKKEKRSKKMAKKSLNERKKEFTKQPKQKINRKSENDNFSKMVSSYKQKLLEAPQAKKAKWYES